MAELTVRLGESGSSTSRMEEAGRSVCSLCGFPLGKWRIQDEVNGEHLEFCCPGCQNVFQVLFNSPDGPPENFRETELFKSCVAAGLIPGGAARPEDPSPAPDKAPPSVQVPDIDDERLTRELTLRIEGMWCTACSWLIEEVLRKLEGVREARVFFFSDMASIRYYPFRIEQEAVLQSISRLGYRASIFEPGKTDASEKKDLFLRLGISAILSANVMMISWALFGGFFQELSVEEIEYLSYPLWVLSTPVLLYGGYPVFKRALLGLYHGIASMDTLIAVGALAAYAYSIVQIGSGSLHLYFDTAAMLVTVVLLGKYIEIQSREKISSGITELYRLAHEKVRLVSGGKEKWVASEAVGVGEEFKVLEGERVPVDGRVISGSAEMDQSALTGESRPVGVAVGSDVMGGSLVLKGELGLRATRPGSESAVTQMIGLIQQALTAKNPVELLADRVTRLLVPAIIILAALTAILMPLTGTSHEEALLRAVTVLVITCPCALGIAVPLAKVAAIEVGKSAGILVRDPAALEHMRELDAIVFDKTGTLTEGRFTLRNILVSGTTETEALARVASLEAHSDHFLARQIVREAQQRSIPPHEVDRLEVLDGLGMRGEVLGSHTVAGNRELMRRFGLDIPEDLNARATSAESEGTTAVFFGWEGHVRGIFLFGDRLRPSSQETIAELTRRGIEVWLVSGDSEATTRAIARELGIDRFVGNALPMTKVEILEGIRKRGLRVGMVGDGVNDAAALAMADVGIAVGAGANLAREASDLTLLSADPARVLEALRLSVLTTSVIRQNLFFAFVYNLLGLPLAVAGVLNPLVAVFAMFASSLTVTWNTLRITRAGRGNGLARS